MPIAMSKNFLEMPENFETAFGSSKERASTTSCHITKLSISHSLTLFKTTYLYCELERRRDPNNNMFTVWNY